MILLLEKAGGCIPITTAARARPNVIVSLSGLQVTLLVLPQNQENQEARTHSQKEG